QFQHFVLAYVKSGAHGGSFRGGYNHFVVHIVIGWAYTVGVTYHKGVAAADKAAYMVAAIEHGKDLQQDVLYVGAVTAMFVVLGQGVVHPLRRGGQGAVLVHFARV